MLRPHLFLTILVFALLGFYIAHFVAGQRTALSPETIPSGSGTGASSGSSGSYKRADNYDYGSRSNRGGYGEDEPGKFDYYALVLSWSPTYCSDQGRDDDTQCNRRDGRRYSFVLHGLWPQYESGYPSDCRLSRRPFVPEPVISSMLDIMPSRGLVIHEYKTHGTCSGMDPAQYFATAHRLFDGINIPDRFRNPFESQIVSAADVEREFLRANPQFRPDMIAVVCGGAGGSLREVRLCLSKDGKPRSCGQNETRRRLCTANQVFIPPSRSTKDNNTWGQSGGSGQSGSANSSPAATDRSSPLPGPRMDYDYGRRAQ
ncbi:ribonuclease T2 [Hyphomicrobium sp. 99]|uniref:ribonuclease T2 family protein n=1 Tax=Hyphomicrobium sp. 99 TaxID=1163419 RepID=UPI0005F783CE|nr:ribonuclease T2 [Hyphomicrobium sp. 99]